MGGRSYGHAQAYRLGSRGELVACCDLRQDTREKYAAQFGLRAYADAAEMLAKGI